MKRLGVWLVMLGLLLAVALQGYALTATEIVNRAANLNAGLKDYQVTLQIAISSPQLEAPRLLVRLSFKRPNKIRLDPLSGFAVLPAKQVMFGNPMANMKDHFKLHLEGERKLKGRRCYLLKMTPKATVQGQPQAPPVFVWIDEERFTLEQMKTSESAFSMLVVFTNAQYEGKYWLPKRLDVTIKGGQEEPSNVKVQFKDYRFNIGLDDSYFTPSEPTQRPFPRMRPRPGAGPHG